MKYYSLNSSNPSFIEKTVTVFPEYTLIAISDSESLVKWDGDVLTPDNWIGSTEISEAEYLSRGGE